MKHLFLGAAAVVLAGAPAAAQTAPSETLREALIKAYQTNPTLTAERANLRATDEGVPIARAAGLPGVTSGGGYTENLYDSAGSAGPLRNTTARVDLSVPVYTGGAVRNSVRAAETRVEAGSTLR